MKALALKIVASTLIALTLSVDVHAQNNPKPYPSDGRIKRVYYQDNNVTPLNGITFTTTQIVFGEDETVIDIEGGDTAVWMVTRHALLNNMVFVKPTVFNSDSNLTIVTDKHAYYFHLTSNKELDTNPLKQTYAIKFIYPQDEKSRAEAAQRRLEKAAADAINPAEHPEKYNWDYRFSGNAQLTPLHVFDDGTFTYFELAPGQAVPAVFAVEDNRGRESVVNSRYSGKYIIIQRIAPQFTLRSGRMVTSVFNTREINRIKSGRRNA